MAKTEKTKSDKSKKFPEINIPKELRDSAHSIWLAGLGAMDAVSEEGSRLFHDLVERGGDVEARGKKGLRNVRERFEESAEKVKDDVGARAKRARAKVEDKYDEWSDDLDRRLADVLRRVGVPRREEIQNLTQRVEELARKLDGLRSGGTGKLATVTVEAVDNGWQVAKKGAKTAATVHDNKAAAVAAAEALARENAPCRLVIHKKDGSVQSEQSFEVS